MRTLLLLRPRLTVWKLPSGADNSQSEWKVHRQHLSRKVTWKHTHKFSLAIFVIDHVPLAIVNNLEFHNSINGYVTTVRLIFPWSRRGRHHDRYGIVWVLVSFAILGGFLRRGSESMGKGWSWRWRLFLLLRLWSMGILSLWIFRGVRIWDLPFGRHRSFATRRARLSLLSKRSRLFFLRQPSAQA